MEGQGGALGCLRIVKLRVVHLIEAVLAKQTADRPKLATTSDDPELPHPDTAGEVGAETTLELGD